MNGWRLRYDDDELKATFSDSTKAAIISPRNATNTIGKLACVSLFGENLLFRAASAVPGIVTL